MEQEKKLVGQSNRLIHAAYSMTLDSKRLLLLALSRLEFGAELPDEAFVVIVTAKEWGNLFGKSDGGNAYSQMKTAADKLMKSQLELSSADGYQRRQWVDQCDYMPNKGQVVIEFGLNIRRNIANLAGGDYTQVDLLQVAGLHGAHAIRIYELCRRWKTTGLVRITMIDLRRMLGVEDAYSVFGNFRAKVLDQSIKDITTNTTMKSLKWKPIKDGTRIVTIEFTFKREI
jgi:plasmid replication initiation protein